MEEVFPSSNLYYDIWFYVPLTIAYSYYKNDITYVVPPPRKPKIFGDYRDIVRYMFGARAPVSYAQNVKCKLSLEKDR